MIHGYALGLANVLARMNVTVMTGVVDLAQLIAALRDGSVVRAWGMYTKLILVPAGILLVQVAVFMENALPRIIAYASLAMLENFAN